MILVVEHESTCPPALFGDGLASFGIGSQIVRPYRGDRLPEDLDEYAGLVVLGGEMAAWDDEVAPWLPAVRALMSRAVSDRVPTLGICLGAQLLALACGGEVVRGSAGFEIGVTTVTALPEADADPYFGVIGDRLGSAQWPVRHFHGDAITVLPPGAELLVTGKVYPHQGFRVGENAWAVQYHPEVPDDGFGEWVVKGAASNGLPADPQAVMAQVHATQQIQAQTSLAHAAAFAAQLG
ncbi:type 1 glutamine amidotransferase [Kineosporia sp. NBRC 101731]|uniref:type 1 glutamine amidotransferase n=1 Tax=Kineosporia sp. NBRC 101731 TaxID=3032199 RepID=UPI0024A226F2|nr:type 1 glutamine amidotransferase [Kineosporia sp. NBRC 101731]GLY32779.1 glutamine amidotransferase [Kineosporia sp. NBRC 101731]